MKTSKKDKLLKFISRKGIVRAKDLSRFDGYRVYLSRLVDSGDLERVGRGLYVATDANPTADRTLAQASKRVPNGVVCLLSALRFHGLTTQLPSQIWIAIEGKAKAPVVKEIPLRIVRFSGEALTAGVEIHKIENVRLQIFSVAKTVADCFKYRNKIGLDLAVEALQDSQKKNKCTVDEIWHFANICRVANVIQPYLEASI